VKDLISCAKRKILSKKAHQDIGKAGFESGSRPTSKFVILNEVKDLISCAKRQILRKRSSEKDRGKAGFESKSRPTFTTKLIF
jgi:hypothetical protein